MRASRLLPLLALVASTISTAGCERAINALTSDPSVRKNVNEKGKASCIQAANAQAKTPFSPEVEAKVVAYCDCITVKGLGQFSNAELMELGIDKEKMKDPKFQARMTTAENACRADVFHK